MQLKSSHWHLLFGLGALSYMALIFYLSSQSNIKVPMKHFRFKDKVLHCIEYGVLAGLLFSALYKFQGRKRLLFAIVLSSLYGLGDEIHQYYVPGRTADPYDFLADCVGSVLGASAMAFIYFMIGKRAPKLENEER